MNKKIAALILFLTAGLSLAGCDVDTSTPTAAQPKTVKTYRIGVIAPMTGDAASYGVEVQRALDYRLAEINANAKEEGYQIALDYEDGKCEGAASALAFQKLTDIDGDKIILGGICSSETLGFIQLLGDKGVLTVSEGNSNPDLEGMSPNFFSLSYSDSLVGANAAKELGKFSKVALISEQNDYNEAMRKVVKKTLAEQFPQTTIVNDEVFPKGATDMRNLLAKINASDAEAVFLNPNAGITGITLVKQLAEIQGWKKQLVSQVSLASPDTIKAAPTTLEGTIIIDAPSLQSQDLKDYMKKITDAKGPLTNLGVYYTASTLDSLNMLSTLASRFDGDPMKMRDAIASEDFSGWIAPTFNFKGKSYVQGIQVARYVITGGESVLSN